jgi:transcription elongation GreA/GreB family factor
MLDSRMSSDRLISFAATVEIPNMSRREEQVWRIVGVAAIAAGIMVAYALSIARALGGA